MPARRRICSSGPRRAARKPGYPVKDNMPSLPRPDEAAEKQAVYGSSYTACCTCMMSAVSKCRADAGNPMDHPLFIRGLPPPAAPCGQVLGDSGSFSPESGSPQGAVPAGIPFPGQDEKALPLTVSPSHFPAWRSGSFRCRARLWPCAKRVHHRFVIISVCMCVILH